jgi:hypothetical protein
VAEAARSVARAAAQAGPIKRLSASPDVRSAAHNGLKSDIVPCPKMLRVSDAGHGASRIATIGRHPKPSTKGDFTKSAAYGAKPTFWLDDEIG